MSEHTTLRDKLIADLRQIPDGEIPAVYAVLHYFRLGLEVSQPEVDATATAILQYAGAWRDMPRATFADLIDECAERRARAFATRRNQPCLQ